MTEVRHKRFGKESRSSKVTLWNDNGEVQKGRSNKESESASECEHQ